MVLYSGWKLKSFDTIWKHGFQYDNVKAHHITWEFGKDAEMPPKATKAKAVGYINDTFIGVEVLIVQVITEDGRKINFQKKEPKLLHITLSHSDKAKPVHANDAVAKGGWLRYPEDQVFYIDIEPKLF